MEKNCIILKSGKVLTIDEAREAKRIYESLCTKEYVEENYPHIPNASSFSVSVRNLMTETEMTEEAVIFFTRQRKRPQKGE